MPTLLVPGNDALHPAEVSALYAESIADYSVAPVAVGDVAMEIGAFCDGIIDGGESTR